MAIVKKGMGKSVKKAQKGTKVPKYDDDANDRLMADTYADYMNDKKRGKIPLSKNIQDGIKNGTLNPDGTIKTGTKRGSESNTSRTPMKKGGVIKKKMQAGGSIESNKFSIPSKNKISIPKKTPKDGSAESNKFKIPSRNKITIPRMDKYEDGGALKPVPAGKKGLAKLPTPVRNKMGFKKNGGTTKKCKYGCK